MTSQSTSLYTPFADGRTVHDIVEHSPALVSEAWCRNLLRQVLRSLEQQYASGAPHRRIAPDTLVMLNNGEALLLPASEDEVTGEATLDADLHALAMVVHYAITAELPPQGPIGPRLYDNYSDSLTQGIDRCLGPNRRLRPKSIAEMRALLGIEDEGLAAPALSSSSAAAAPEADIAASSFVPAQDEVNAVPPPALATVAEIVPEIDTPPSPAHDTSFAALTEDRPAGIPADRWVDELTEKAAAGAPRDAAEGVDDGVAGAAAEQATEQAAGQRIAPSAHIKMSSAPPPRSREKRARAMASADPSRVQRWAMIAGAAVVLLAAGSALVAFLRGSGSHDVVALSLPPSERAAGSPGRDDVAAAPALPPPADPASGATAAPAVPGPAPDSATDGVPGLVPGTAPGIATPAPRAADAVVNGTTYKLMIKPWGTVYVNGVDRGVSPPVKRLTLGPGTHTIRIVNPNFPEHVRTLTAGTEEGATIEHDFTAKAE